MCWKCCLIWKLCDWNHVFLPQWHNGEFTLSATKANYEKTIEPDKVEKRVVISSSLIIHVSEFPPRSVFLSLTIQPTCDEHNYTVIVLATHSGTFSAPVWPKLCSLNNIHQHNESESGHLKALNTWFSAPSTWRQTVWVDVLFRARPEESQSN